MEVHYVMWSQITDLLTFRSTNTVSLTRATIALKVAYNHLKNKQYYRIENPTDGLF